VNDMTWYLVGAGLWIFATGFNHALYRSKWTARAFFAFPVWPVALVVFAGMGLVPPLARGLFGGGGCLKKL
jgi:hypothetical protein